MKRIHSGYAAQAGFYFFCILFLTIGGCGGGGGGSSATNTTPPYIQANLTSFPTGAVLPGFATPTTNSYVTVQILNKLGGTQVSNAAVSVNGVALDYNTQFADYEGPLTVSAGDTVQLTVALNGSTYTVAATQVASYPAIGAPLANANWANGSSNLLSWSAPLIGPANTSYAIGVFGSNASLVWPANGKAQILPTSTTSYSIGAGNLAPGNGWVFAAQTYSVSIANADPSSSMQFIGANYQPITITATPPVTNTPAATLSSISITPSSTVISTGQTLQFNATGTYSDASTHDLNAQVT